MENIRNENEINIYKLILEIIEEFASMVESDILIEKGCGLDALLRDTSKQKLKKGLPSAIDYIFDLEKEMQEKVELSKNLKNKLEELHIRTK